MTILTRQERERLVLDLYNQAKTRGYYNRIKSNNEEYVKIEQAAEENVKSVLTNSKIFLNFAAASVIESLRRNPELCNFVLFGISDNNNGTTYGS